MENVIASDLADYYNEQYDDKRLTDNMLLGEIILLYKKKDPRDIRNYRPITLLVAAQAFSRRVSKVRPGDGVFHTVLQHFS